MHFNSIEYVLFLWAVFVLFWSLQGRRPLRHGMALAASYFFYAQADWRFCSLLLISSLVDFKAGRSVHAARLAGNTRRARLWLVFSLCANLGILGFFKYSNFFVQSFEDLLSRLGLEPDLWHVGVVVPVGISFYTFQTLSYTLDIYRGRMRPVASFLDFALFVSFFPQLVAGPIVRARQFLPQLEHPARLTSERIGSGLFQILRGMAKKLLIADILGANLVDRVYADVDSISAAGAPLLLLATYAYALQLYGDFAGYSDIAIGSARLLGFELPKNFDAPYKSRSLEEFWRRWHISMSSWFVDYVYVGLGGGKGSFARIGRNVLVTWVLVGLWHGAAWNFVLWGLYHAVWLVVVRGVRRLLPGGRMPASPLFALLGGLFTFHVVAFSMVLFRCPDLAAFGAACAGLLDWSAGLPSIPGGIWIVLAAGYALHLLPERLKDSVGQGFVRSPRLAQAAIVAGCILLFFALRPPGLTPFIYFQF